MLYSYNNQYPNTIPFRIILSDGRTRTDPSSFTEAEITDAGYTAVEDTPIILDTQILTWVSETMSWSVRNKTEEELSNELNEKRLNKEVEIRGARNKLLAESDWTQLSDSPVNKEAWAIYRQQLRDITIQSEFPMNVVWPEKL